MTVPRTLGIGHLAAAGFPQCWDRTGEGAVAHLRRYAAAEDRPVAAEYAADARDLLATALTDEQLELLWCSATGGNHRPSRDGLSGREWFRLVHDVMAGRATPEPVRHADHHPGLTGRVLGAIGHFHAHHQFSACAVRDDAARAALAEVVRAGFPGLALRLLLTMVPAHLMPLSPALFAELTDLGAAIGLDEWTLDRLDFLVTTL